MKVFFREWLLDPFVKHIGSRLDHLQAMRVKDRDGKSWSSVGIIGSAVTLHEEAVAINPRGRDALQVGDYSRIHGQLWVFDDGSISVGHHSFVGLGSRLWSSKRIHIGNYVLISHLVDIHDGNSHSLDWRERRAEINARLERGDDSPPTNANSAPVIIEDDVWIGFKSTILKGVTIGRGAVVAAGSVVTKDVPPFTLVAGNPAKVVRTTTEHTVENGAKE